MKSNVKRKWETLINLPKTVYFNFHYLPFKQAIKLPISLCNADLQNCSGKVILDMPDTEIKHSMIILGHRFASIYPNSGIMWENRGGTVIFKGKCKIGADSYLSFGKHTTVSFGDDFNVGAALKVISYRGIQFGKSTRFGWQCLVMDTNFHPLYDIKNKKFKRASSPITIGDYNWFGTQCKIMHGVNTPERCIFGMGTIINRGCEMKSYCVMGGSPVKVLTENVMRIIGQDKEEE